jgi:hypothetical protein
MGPFKTKSDFSRSHATEVAAAASLRWITSRTDHDEFWDRWFITPLGLRVLYIKKEL